jgi:uncharacterized membrane protein
MHKRSFNSSWHWFGHVFIFLLLFFIASATFTVIIMLTDARNAAHVYLIVYKYVRTEVDILILA